MKTTIFYFLLLGVLVASCKKPEACLNASTSTVKVGQEITFTDCSTDQKKSKIYYGDGSKGVEIKGTIKYGYDNPGTFTAKIEVFKSSDKVKDESSTTITVEAPTEAELTANWEMYREETYSMGYSVFSSRSEEWIVDALGGYTVDGGSPYTWSLSGNILQTNDSEGSYSITKLYADELVLRYNYISFFGVVTYNAYHFRKI